MAAGVKNLQEDQRACSIRTPSTSAPAAWYGKNDEHALVALARGELTADPFTGHVDYRGRPAGHATPDGYIVIGIHRHGSRGWISIGAHRIVWMAHVAPIPAGMVVRHRNQRHWDNRLANLVLAAQADNRHAVGRYGEIRRATEAA